MMADPNQQRGMRILRVMALVALVLFFKAVIPLNAPRIEEFIKGTGPLSPVIYSLMMIAGCLFAPLPTAPLTLMSPRLFGLWGGLVLSLGSATVGALLAFWIARRLGPRLFEIFPKSRRLQHLLPPGTTTWAVFLLRLPPSPTFDLVSYLAGLTKISAGQFALATFLGMIPVTATLCFVGSILPAVWLWPLIGVCCLLGAWSWWRRK